MKEKILVVDDEKEITDLVALYLENEGFQVYKFYDSREALECARREEMDLAVLDIMMPGMDGISVLKALREAGVTTPALFLTARSEVSQRVEGLDAGADDYLPKPFSTAELLARVRAMLRGKTTTCLIC